MTLSRLCLLGLLALATTAASAQSIWKWRDRDGHVMVSDRPPGAEVPDKDILQRPSAAHMAAAPSDAASPSAPPASAGIDKDLEARKNKLAQAQAADKDAKIKATKERVSAEKAQNCQRARNQLQMLQSGARMARANDKGEREFLDDKARAEEITRAQQQISNSCD
ncbi:DUF4124 domain-containing protein [Ideonella oryzae]|uniref:DUF4124 domain-containing protein n=1 Tax=Ideonella oryzae TaxID=2937441 RepID=A0ABT1BTP8_9BURK|nr:DUF4124 domain-containing protein [Ideonella oryzae]MCO5979214.1 DUF4124 domain-containing protein [Ideonella oryzae]